MVLLGVSYARSERKSLSLANFICICQTRLGGNGKNDKGRRRMARFNSIAKCLTHRQKKQEQLKNLEPSFLRSERKSLSLANFICICQTRLGGNGKNDKGRRRMERFKSIAKCLTHRQKKKELKEFRALLFIVD
jgi:hypothetical protein